MQIRFADAASFRQLCPGPSRRRCRARQPCVARRASRGGRGGGARPAVRGRSWRGGRNLDRRQRRGAGAPAGADRDRQRVGRRGGREARRRGGRTAADIGREDAGDRPQRHAIRRRRRGAAGAWRGVAGVALRPLSHQAQGQAEAERRGSGDRRRAGRCRRALERALRRRAGGHQADPRTGHRTCQHHLRRNLRRAGAEGGRGHRARDRGAWARPRWKSSAWARSCASTRARSASRGCWSCAGTAAAIRPTSRWR